MGEGFRARDPRLGRDVALKVLPEIFARDESRRARFSQEARAAGALNHPGIVTVYDIGFEDGVFYMVTELVEGPTLRALMEEGRIPHRRMVSRDERTIYYQYRKRVEQDIVMVEPFR
jgi:serine/threonine protein kinase